MSRLPAAIDLEPIMTGRRSVRAFRADPVPEADLTAILEAARWAPSPHGRQPWRFAVITRAATKLRLAEAMGAEWRRQLSLDGQDNTTIELRFQKSHERIVGAPVIVIPCLYLNDLDVYPDAERQAAETIMAIQSLGCAVQNMLLTAYARGLDSGWMCAPLFCQPTVRDALGLDASLQPHALIPIGYAAQDPKRRPRRPLDELIVFRDDRAAM